MSVSVNIKLLRRAETEIQNELAHVSSRLNNTRHEREPTQESATTAGEISCNSFLKRYTELMTAKFDIRAAVGKFNEAEGINGKTTKIAMLEGLLSAYEKAEGYGRVSRNSGYGSTEVTYTPGVSDEVVDSYRTEVRRIRREIQSLKDSCNGVNASKDASSYVDVNLIEFLKSNKFID